MDLFDLKKKRLLAKLGIDSSYGKIWAFLDFGNINHWYTDDRHKVDGEVLADDERWSIDLKALKEFADVIASDARFYYGHDAANPGSLGFIRAARDIYGKHRVFTKPMQKIRHHLTPEETQTNTREVHADDEGAYIHIPKCNFDVEIAVDAIKHMASYDTFCLFSSDADFVHLARFLKGKGKKVVLVKGGHIVHQLRGISDLVVSAQDIKDQIATIKQKPGR